MMRVLAVVVLLIVGVGFSSAQKVPKIKFESLKHHFGQIKEESSPVRYDFKFKNTGSAPLKISEVSATCGSTTPTWSKAAINPGDSGLVTVEFNPYNRPGYFSKTITVSTNAEPKMVVLTIEGNVKPKAKSPEAEYPYEMGKLRAANKVLNFGKVLTTTEPTERAFEVYNNSKDTLKFTTFEVPSFIKVSIPTKIAPHKVEKIIIKFDAKAYADLGYTYDKLILLTNETTKAQKEFFISANVEEYFPPMTEQELAKAPKLVLETALHDFGNINNQQAVDVGFVLRNDGLSDLNIRKVKANCECTVAQLEKSTLSPGESSFIRVIFNPEGKVSYQQKSISIFSNDPKAPTQIITIKANVLE